MNKATIPRKKGDPEGPEATVNLSSNTKKACSAKASRRLVPHAIHSNEAMGTGIKTIDFCRSVFLMKEASSKVHQSLVNVLGDHKTKSRLDLFRNPAKPRIPWFLSPGSPCAMQSRSTNKSGTEQQSARRIRCQKHKKQKYTTYVKRLAVHHPPGSLSRSSSPEVTKLTRTAAKAAGKLLKINSKDKVFCQRPVCQSWLTK